MYRKSADHKPGVLASTVEGSDVRKGGINWSTLGNVWDSMDMRDPAIKAEGWNSYWVISSKYTPEYS